MAVITATSAVSLRSSPSPRRRPMLVKATPTSHSTSPLPILSTLRLAASAAVLLTATSPAHAWAPIARPPQPTPTLLAGTVSPDPEGCDHATFEKLICLTAACTGFGRADDARAFLSAAASSRGGESCARLLAAQALLVDGKVDEAIAAFKKLAREDPRDYRPLFCQAALYFFLGRVGESFWLLARCRDVPGDKLDRECAAFFSEIEEHIARGGSRRRRWRRRPAKQAGMLR